MSIYLTGENNIKKHKKNLFKLLAIFFFSSLVLHPFKTLKICFLTLLTFGGYKVVQKKAKGKRAWKFIALLVLAALTVVLAMFMFPEFRITVTGFF